MIVLTLLISLAYLLLIINLLKHWEAIPVVAPPKKSQKEISLSVIIIARNEEENIKKCLESILANEFPKSLYEIIVVDDHSEDRTVQEIESLNNPNISVLNLGDFINQENINAFKKAGIQYALQESTHDFIIHTDADCIVPTNWLKTTAWNFKQGAKLQAGPVKNWYLANGANLAYAKNDLLENVYAESDRYASGDDVYLINRFAEKYGDEIIFEASIPITTKPVEDLKSFINQRKRWAGKNRQLAKGKMKNILIIPVLANLWIFALFIFIFFNPTIGLNLLVFYILLKLMVDYVLLDYMQKNTHPDRLNKTFLRSSMIYPFYFLGIGIVAYFTQSYQWKSRSVR